jgi:hypothetical protein
MPSFVDQVTKDIADAMRQKIQGTLAPLRMLKAALMNREVEKGRPLDEAEVAFLSRKRDEVAVREPLRIRASDTGRSVELQPSNGAFYRRCRLWWINERSDDSRQQPR